MDNFERTESADGGQVTPRLELNSADVFNWKGNSPEKESSSSERREVDCADSSLCFNDPYFIGDGVADSERSAFEPRTGSGKGDFVESRLKTGDVLTHDGDKTTLEMPSGEKLVFYGTNWSLLGTDGDKIAGNRTGELRLADGASIDRVIPLIGPSWTSIHYPNGDQISIKGEEVTVTRAEEVSKFPLRTPLVNY